jgi:hypothetical protein
LEAVMTQRIARLMGIGGLALGLMPAWAGAQTVAVEATAVAVRDARDGRFNKHAWGGGLNAFWIISPHWSLGAETEWPESRAFIRPYQSTNASGAVTVGQHREDMRRPTISMAVSRRLFTARGVDVRTTFGLGFERRDHRYRTSTDTTDKAGVVTHNDYDWPTSFTWLYLPMGVEVVVPLTPHVALVPQARMAIDPLGFLNDGCCGGPQYRLRLGVRCSF